MKAFALATPDFDQITREHFLSTIPLSGLELHMRTVDDMGHVGDFDTPSMLALAMRRDREILQLLETEKEPFLVTDCDVRFYGAPKMTAETFAGLGREYAWLANVKDESAWECAQAMLPGRSRNRWRLVYVAAETKAVLAASEQLYEAEADVVMPAMLSEVPEALRDGVSGGRVKVAIQEVEVA